MPLPQPQTSGMRKILFLVKHDTGKVCMDVITFIVKLHEEYFCFLIGRKGFVGGYSGCGNDRISW